MATKFNNLNNQNTGTEHLSSEEKKNPLFIFNQKVQNTVAKTALALQLISFSTPAYSAINKVSSGGGVGSIEKNINNNNLTPKDQEEIEKLRIELRSISFLSDEEKISIIKRSEDVRIAIQKGELPPQFIYEIKTTNGINTPKDLNYIINSGELLKPKTFKEITGLDYLKSPKEWTTVINALFDTSDIDGWLRYGKEARQLTEKEKQDYVADMEKVKNAWLTKISVWQSAMKFIDQKTGKKEGTTFNKFIKDGLNLFKYTVDNTNFPSREILRRQFVNSFSIAYGEAIPEDELYSMIENLSSQIGEYVLLTTPNTKALTTTYGKLKYISMDDKILENIPSLKYYGDYQIFDKTLTKMSNRYDTDKEGAINTLEIESLVNEVAKSKKDAESAKKDAESAKKDAESAKKDAESAKKDADSVKIELGYTNKRLEITKTLNVLGKEILNNVSKYNSTGSKDALFNAQIGVGQMRGLIKEAQELLNQTKDSALKQEINNGINSINSYIAKLDKKFLPN